MAVRLASRGAEGQIMFVGVGRPKLLLAEHDHEPRRYLDASVHGLRLQACELPLGVRVLRRGHDAGVEVDVPQRLADPRAEADGRGDDLPPSVLRPLLHRPLRGPVADLLHIPDRVINALWLIAVGAVIVELNEIGSSL